MTFRTSGNDNASDKMIHDRCCGQRLIGQIVQNKQVLTVFLLVYPESRRTSGGTNQSILDALAAEWRSHLNLP